MAKKDDRNAAFFAEMKQNEQARILENSNLEKQKLMQMSTKQRAECAEEQQRGKEYERRREQELQALVRQSNKYAQRRGRGRGRGSGSGRQKGTVASFSAEMKQADAGGSLASLATATKGSFHSPRRVSINTQGDGSAVVSHHLVRNDEKGNVRTNGLSTMRISIDLSEDENAEIILEQMISR